MKGMKEKRLSFLFKKKDKNEGSGKRKEGGMKKVGLERRKGR